MNDWPIEKGFTPVVAQALRKAVESAPRGAILALDWDETCVHGDAGDSVFWGMALELLYAVDQPCFWELMDQGESARAARAAIQSRDGDALCCAISERYEQVLAQQGPQSAYTWQSRLLAGLTPLQLSRRIRRVLRAQVGQPPGLHRLADGRQIRLGMTARAPMRDLAHLARKHGMRVVVISVSHVQAVLAAAELTKFPAHLVLGNRTHPRGDRLGMRLAIPVIYGPGKVAALRMACGADPWIAIGDSDFDLPLLQSARCLGMLIHPLDPALIKRAAELGIMVEPRPSGH
ncbi:MAG: haloacid dehalogenase-like hydrolase [Candidatus Alcyoniella australis]|nr:haloacid dehalogenase-like hydrolase [Candidatus Alcyoniella australis]